MKRLWFTLAAIALLALVLSACVSEPAVAPVEYEQDLDVYVDYAGIWFSGEEDGRAYLLYEHGMYSLFEVSMGEDPVKTESGLYKKIVGEDYLSFGNPVNQVFSEKYRLEVQLEDYTIYDGDIEFVRVTMDQDEGYVGSLMTMGIPMDAYLGEWENDSNFTQLIVNDDHYILMLADVTRTGSIEKHSDHLILFMMGGEVQLDPTSDGGLILEGIDGMFYEKGSDMVLDGPHRIFIGTWVNETSDDVFNFLEDGTFFWKPGDGSTTYGRFDVDENIITIPYGDETFIGDMYLEDTISISGFVGEFYRHE